MDDLGGSFMERVQFDTNGGCWLWQGDQVNGYGRVQVAGYSMATHMSLALFKGQQPIDGMVVMHSCDTPLCVNPDHLSWASQRDNIHDARAKGRLVSNWPRRRGEDVSSAKLSNAQRAEISRRHDAGDAADDLAVRYGVSRSTIFRVCSAQSQPGLNTIEEPKREKVKP